MIGLTSHQRKLAAGWAQQAVDSGAAGKAAASQLAEGALARPEAGSHEAPRHRLDMLMVRYNLAHRGAEREVFPAAVARRMPVVTFTGLRWRALIEPTPHDPEGFRPPLASECYRFCLSNPAVSVALMAPGNRGHLEENLRLLDDWRPSEPSETQDLLAHGDRVHQHASEFW
jgi:aryl-alcohol dehydrogenase-like predicted oxidoreductase